MNHWHLNASHTPNPVNMLKPQSSTHTQPTPQQLEAPPSHSSVMVSDLLGQSPHDDNDHLSLLSYCTSIQNSLDWPSVRSLSPYPSVQTLNGPNDEEDNEDILSLANFVDLDRSSVLMVCTLTLPVNSCSSTLHACEHMHIYSLEQGVHACELEHRHAHSHSAHY